MLYDDCYREPEEPTPQKIFTEVHDLDQLVVVRKQDVKLGIGMTVFELEAALAMLDWWLMARPMAAEIEQLKDDLLHVIVMKEGK